MSNSNASCFRVALSWVELRWVLTTANVSDLSDWGLSKIIVVGLYIETRPGSKVFIFGDFESEYFSPGHLLLVSWSWFFGPGYLVLVFCSLSFNPGPLVLVLWSWPLELVLWSWSYGPGSLIKVLWYWSFGLCAYFDLHTKSNLPGMPGTGLKVPGGWWVGGGWWWVVESNFSVQLRPKLKNNILVSQVNYIW